MITSEAPHRVPIHTSDRRNRTSDDLDRLSKIQRQKLARRHLHTALPGATVEDAVEAALYDYMRPELIGRFEKKLIFMPLGYSHLAASDQEDMIQREISRLAKLGHALACGANTVEIRCPTKRS